MAICSKFYSTAEVLAAVLESNDEDLFEKDIGFMRPSVENVNNLYSHAEKFISWKFKVVSVVICRAFFSQTEYSMKTKFINLLKDEVQHLKSIKPGLICTKYWIQKVIK